MQHLTQVLDLSVPHLSCSYVDITTYLLSKGADATLGSQKGDTALHMAARTAHAACITRLLTYRVLSPEGQPTRSASALLMQPAGMVMPAMFLEPVVCCMCKVSAAGRGGLDSK